MKSGGDRPGGGTGSDLPVACTLTPAELLARRENLLPGLLARAATREEISDGYRWVFRPADGLVREIAAIIEAEHQCCRFLQFRLTVEPGDGEIHLEVSGPEGTQEFLAGLVRPGPAGAVDP